jgi:uncharacterized protein (TIRG00374 family)
MTKKLLTIGVSLAILTAIYLKLDTARLADAFRHSDPGFLALSLGMVVPLTLLTAWRLQTLAPRSTELGFAESNRLILVASVLNMVLPSKMGDIAKAYFMAGRGGAGGTVTLSLVIFEKACDMLSLLLWCVFGLMLYPGKDALFWALTGAVASGLALGVTLLASRKLATAFFSLAAGLIPRKKEAAARKMEAGWREMQDFFWADTGRVFRVTGLSVFIWFLHLLQIWLFILALRAWAPFVAGLGLAPLAILAGLLPLTFAGVGTRDAALILLYKPYFDAATAAALGLLCTSRYLLPALAGLPFLHQYLGAIRSFRASTTTKEEPAGAPSPAS